MRSLLRMSAILLLPVAAAIGQPNPTPPLPPEKEKAKSDAVPNLAVKVTVEDLMAVREKRAISLDDDVVLRSLVDLPLRSAPPSGLFYLSGDRIGTVPKGTVLTATEVAPIRTLFGDYQWLKVELADPAKPKEKKTGWVYLGKKDAAMTLTAGPR